MRTLEHPLGKNKVLLLCKEMIENRIMQNLHNKTEKQWKTKLETKNKGKNFKTLQIWYILNHLLFNYF